MLNRTLRYKRLGQHQPSPLNSRLNLQTRKTHIILNYLLTSSQKPVLQQLINPLILIKPTNRNIKTNSSSLRYSPQQRKAYKRIYSNKSRPPNKRYKRPRASSYTSNDGLPFISSLFPSIFRLEFRIKRQKWKDSSSFGSFIRS